jgi:hypothetical protein
MVVGPGDCFDIEFADLDDRHLGGIFGVHDRDRRHRTLAVASGGEDGDLLAVR